MKAYVDKNLCIFCGICGGVCPEIFSADTDGKSVALDIELNEAILVQAKLAEALCPCRAIVIKVSD